MIRSTVSFALAALLVPTVAICATAEPALPRIEPDPGRLEAESAEVFLDGIVAGQMQAYPLMGVLVCLTYNGRILVAKGYGVADVATREPLDPSRHLVSVASITKLFTWTAVMQLVEGGELDLHTDVNKYLDFAIPPTYDRPITLAHLMSHTAGLDNRTMYMRVRGDDPVPPLRGWLVANLPARVRPPGEISAYSNYGAALAGHIVARTAGTSFEAYVEERILQPLGMMHSTCRQPLPAQLAGQRASSYDVGAGEPRAISYTKMPDVPSGALYSTATDMGRFMLAHLGEGRLNEVRILRPETTRKMHRTLFSHTPGFPGWAHGFEELPSDGPRLIGHGGAFMGYCSQLTLVPEHGLGIFVAYTTEYGCRARCALLRAIIERYFSKRQALPALRAEDFTARGRLLSGFYRSARRTHTTIEKAAELTTPPLELIVREGSVINFNWAHWYETAPFVFHQIGGDSVLTFRRSDDGQAVTHAFVNAWAYEKLRWFEVPSFHARLAVVCAVVLVAAAVGWPVAAVVRQRRRGQPRPRQTRLARLCWLMGWLVAALAVLLLAALGIVLSGNTDELAYGIPMGLRLLLLLPFVLAVLECLCLAATLLAWARRYWGIIGRVHHTLVAVVGGVVIWFLHFWNLIGWRF